MPKVFVSYARADQEIVQSLVRELQELGYDPFYDQNLTGGQRWWDVLLDQIQAADGFLPVLTSEYRQSEACHREAVWAESLGVPFVPIDLGQASPELFEKVVAEANWVHYSLDDRGSVARLARALGAMHKPEPPAPLPPRPAIPISYFAELEREIRTMPAIPLERQFAIVATLRAKLYTREDASARIMLGELRSRTDITYSNAVDIERMLAGLAPEQAAQQRAQPVDSRQHHWHHDAGQPQSRPGAGSQQPTGTQPGTPFQRDAAFQPNAGHRQGTGSQYGGGQAIGHPPGPCPPRSTYQQLGPQTTQRSARASGSAGAIARLGLSGIGLLLVVLALFAVDWVRFSNGNTADYGRIHDIIGPHDVGIAVAYFKWLGYLLTVLALVLIAICLFIPRRPRVFVQITVGVVLIHIIITIAATVSEVNRLHDLLASQQVDAGYDGGLWLMIVGIVLATIGCLIPHQPRPEPGGGYDVQTR